MATKIIVSYDGTDNDRDALALGALLKRAGASLELAYVRHIREAKESAERLAESDAEALLAAGAQELGDADDPAARRPQQLDSRRARATSRSRCRPTSWRSAPPTARRPAHVDPQPSARQLLDGGPVAIAIAPAGFAQVGEYAVNSIAAIAEDGDPCPEETAEALAARLGATVAARGTGGGDLIIVGSKTGTVDGPRDDQCGGRVPDRARPLTGARASARRCPAFRLDLRRAGRKRPTDVGGCARGTGGSSGVDLARACVVGIAVVRGRSTRRRRIERSKVTSRGCIADDQRQGIDGRRRRYLGLRSALRRC